MPRKTRIAIDPNAHKDLDLNIDIQYVPIDSIHPNSYNANRQSDHEFELLCRSIEEDGFTQPVFVNIDTRDIVDGEHRWRAMRALGYTEVPVVMKHVDEIQQRIATLRHNRARGTEDLQRTADVFKELSEMGALDHAADSLILDDVDLDFMIKSIPESELRTRTENMTYEETVASIQQEQQLEATKKAQAAAAVAKDNQKLTLQLTFLNEEATVISAVVGRKPAAGILKLCKWHLELPSESPSDQAPLS